VDKFVISSLLLAQMTVRYLKCIAYKGQPTIVKMGQLWSWKVTYSSTVHKTTCQPSPVTMPCSHHFTNTVTTAMHYLLLFHTVECPHMPLLFALYSDHTHKHCIPRYRWFHTLLWKEYARSVVCIRNNVWTVGPSECFDISSDRKEID